MNTYIYIFQQKKAFHYELINLTLWHPGKWSYAEEESHEGRFCASALP